jgi:DNA-binding MarR family transcriptional regulator
MSWDLSEEEIQELFAAMRGEEVIDLDDDEDDSPEAERNEAIASLPLLVRRANNRFDFELRRAARALGYPDVGPSGLHVLRLVGSRGRPISLLAELLGMTRQAAAQAVARLDERGLTSRRESLTNTRVVCTPDGRRLLREVNEAMVDLVWSWGMVSDVSRIAALARDLEVLAQNPRRRFG